jgi:hypothetical protein
MEPEGHYRAHPYSEAYESSPHTPTLFIWDLF